jgi:tetratricopeptide (TPR) repeat protein
MIATTTKKNFTPSEKSSRVMLLERLAFLYRANDQLQNAADAFKQIGEVDPELAARSAAQVIDTYRLAHDYKKAADAGDAAIKEYPTDRTVRAVRASVLAEVGRGDEAITETRKLLDGKNDRETYISLAQIYEKMKNYGEMAKSIDAADKLSQAKEDKETIAFMRGAMYEKQKNYDKAEAEFRKVLEVNPASASALNYLGYMLADRGVRLWRPNRTMAPIWTAWAGSTIGWISCRKRKGTSAWPWSATQKIPRYTIIWATCSLSRAN